MIWVTSKHEGVRYREHKTRRHGRLPDRYIIIRYRMDGRRIEEVIGWTSQGASLSRAAEILAVLKQNHRTGTGPQTLAELRALHDKARKKEASDQAGLPKTLADLFAAYIESAKSTKSSWTSDAEIFRRRLTSLHATPLADISPGLMDKLKTTLAKTYAAASVRHALGLVRRMWRWAAVQYGETWTETMPGDPLRGVRMPAVKNQRLRYLTPDEADRLLKWCSEHDAAMHDVILLGLYTGLRRGELADLRVGHIDRAARIINIIDPKSGVARETVSIPDNLLPMIAARIDGRKNTDRLFQSLGTGGRISTLSKRFTVAANAVGLNDDIAGGQYKATLHTLRHTYISWLVMRGIDMRTVQEMARHRSYEMTLRYAHLAPRACHDAANQLPKFED